MERRIIKLTSTVTLEHFYFGIEQIFHQFFIDTKMGKHLRLDTHRVNPSKTRVVVHKNDIILKTQIRRDGGLPNIGMNYLQGFFTKMFDFLK